MATQQIEFVAAGGLTLTAALYAAGNDTAAYTASAVVEQTNRTGVYRATFSSVAAGTYQLIAKSGAMTVASWWGFAQDVAQTFTFGELAGSLTPNASAELVAVKGKTDQLTFPIAGKVDAVSGGFGPDSITASVLATDAVSEIANAVTSQLSGTPVTVLSPLAANGSLVVYNNRKYGSPAHQPISFTVSKNYSAATSVELVFYEQSSPATHIATMAVTVVSSTLLTASGLLNVSDSLFGSTGAIQCRYSLFANWSTDQETIATDKAVIYGQPE